MRTTRENWHDKCMYKAADIPQRAVASPPYETWVQILAGDGTGFDPYHSRIAYAPYLPHQWVSFSRALFIWDPVRVAHYGSGMHPAAVTSGARVKIFCNKYDPYYGTKPTFNIYEAFPFIPGEVSVIDYQNIDITPFCDSDTLYDDIVENARHTFEIGAAFLPFPVDVYINLGVRMANFDVGGVEPDSFIFTQGLHVFTLGPMVPSKYAILELDYESPPTARTEPTATNIEDTTATLNGRLWIDGGLACDCHFEYGLDTSYGDTTPPQPVVEDNPTIQGLFHADIAGLIPATTYHFRAVAENSMGVDYGDDIVFTTKGGAPALAWAQIIG